MCVPGLEERLDEDAKCKPSKHRRQPPGAQLEDKTCSRKSSLFPIHHEKHTMVPPGIANDREEAIA